MEATGDVKRMSAALSGEPIEQSYGEDYFAPQLQNNILGVPRGSRPFLYGYWARYLRNICARGAPVLEIGCGLGFFVGRLRRRFAAVGLDISYVALRQAQQRWDLRTLICGDAGSLPFQEDGFAALFAFDVIEHLSDPSSFLSEANRVLRRGGFMVISTPNPRSLGARLKREKWFAYRDHTHIGIQAIEEWRESFKRSGFSVVKDGSDLLWDPPYIAWLPRGMQKIVCISTQWLLTWAVGFLPWSLGENYVAVLQKPD